MNEFNPTAEQPVLVERVATALSRNGYTHFLCLETLKVITLNEKLYFTEEEMDKIESAPDQYLQILPYSDQKRQQLRRLFVKRLADTTVQKELLAAIESYDSTSAFRRAIAQYDDICAQWHYFRDRYFLEEAKQWLYENGLGNLSTTQSNS